MSDEEDYEFEYSDEEDNEDEFNVQIENQYYTAKALAEQDIEQSINGFKKVLEMEEEKGDWGFKAIKRIVKLLFKLQQHDEMMKYYENLLSYTKTAVTRNVGEKGINSILDYVSTSEDWTVLQRFYEATLEALKEASNERLWFKTNVKLGNLLFETGDYRRLNKVVKELLKSCEAEDGDGDDTTKKGTQLLDVYALQIQMYTAQKDNKKLALLYEKALRIKSGIPHPKIVGVIRECGGKMYMMQHEWGKARTDFFEGFKSFDEAGEPRRLQCLKYLVLANMLSESKINVFDSQEAKPYENDRDITAMTKLTEAFLRDEIREFEIILKRNRESIMEDPFIKHYVDNLLRTIRSKVLVKIIRPYTKISLAYISDELNGISRSEVESLIVALILDGRIQGRIDQVEGYLVLQTGNQNNKAYQAISKWSVQVRKLHQTMLQKANA